MKNRLAISTPKKIRLIYGYEEEATLVANKGDYIGRKYIILGDKKYCENDVWDFHEPYLHNIECEYNDEYIRRGNKLFVKPRVRIIYGDKWYDDKFFSTDEEAEQCYNELVEAFRLTEVDF